MNKEIAIKVNKDVYEKFCVALSLMKEEQDEVIEKVMRQYISDCFAKTSKRYNPNSRGIAHHAREETDEGKANRRIPAWTFKPQQYNHKIIHTFFKV